MIDFSAAQYNSSHVHLPFIGNEGIAALQKARVLVIGAGGLGCPCLLYLAGCSIGKLGIADDDTVDNSNLHRQLLYTPSHIGCFKADSAAQIIQQHNPAIQTAIHRTRVTAENVIEIISHYDIVVDATDNFYSRYLINDACVFLNKPLVYGAIHQQDGHVTVFNYRESATLRCLFPDNDAENGAIPSCSQIGAYNIVTGMIGMAMANETVKSILHHPDVFCNKLWCIDTLNYQTKVFGYAKQANHVATAFARFSENPSTTEAASINYAELQALTQQHGQHLVLIDVRSNSERAMQHIGGNHIVGDLLLQQPEAYLNHTFLYVLYCNNGTRSQLIANRLTEKGFKVLSLKHRL